MAISDMYVTQHLLEETICDSMAWRESESGGYFADRNGVRVEVTVEHSRTGQRIYIAIGDGLYKVHIAEPVSTGVFRPKYNDGDQLRLATVVRELFEAVVAQCARRERMARESADRVRNALFQRLLFGEADHSRLTFTEELDAIGKTL